MASRSGGSLRGRAHITQQSIKKLEYQSHINSLAIAEAEATHGVAIHRAKALDRKLDRLQLSVEEYIGFLELEYQRVKSTCLESQCKAIEHEAETEVLKHNLHCARDKLDKLLWELTSEEHLNLSTTNATAVAPSSTSSLVGVDAGVRVIGAGSRLGCDSLQAYALHVPEYAMHQEAVSSFKHQQQELEKLCSALKQKLHECQLEEERIDSNQEESYHPHPHQSVNITHTHTTMSMRNSRERALLETSMIDLFRVVARVESQVFQQHEHVSKNYDLLLEKYMSMIDDLRIMKQQIKKSIGISK